ncbi:MAG: formate dehydrogenase accessory sulfurtransferase FdhD [Acidobacteriaceae bacterium]|nr:formate dehydrogenase accessory sulfurtransferase FdhD [Acidobacteriaceae bacterium]
MSIKCVAPSHWERLVDRVAVEEPLDIHLQHWFKGVRVTENLALMMRTPGNDRELAAGFLFSEGIIQSREEIQEMRSLGGEGSNELLVELSDEVDVEIWRMSRAAFVNSSCGVCGKRSIEALHRQSRIAPDDKFLIDAVVFNELPNKLSQAQKGFAQTGGLHAAALVDGVGHIIEDAVFEDIGRHNALDKLIGSRVLKGETCLAECVLFLSSRSSFELVQKAAAAGVPVLATVGSPSSLSIESARSCGLTLLGFVRNNRFNIYAGEWRIIGAG